MTLSGDGPTVEILTDIPVRVDPRAASRRLRFGPGHGFRSLDELLGEALPLVTLRAVTGVAYTGEKTEAGVEVSGVRFLSRILRTNLEHAQKVFPFIMTVGAGLEAAAAASGDLLRQYYLEEAANLILESGAAWLAGRLGERWGLGDLSAMSPGSLEDWPITEQPKLFSLFGDAKRLVGVELTDSLLMLPRKSISGLFFPSAEGFLSCRLCERGDCPARQAPYDEAAARQAGIRRSA
jgi:hypothetical protein